MKCVSNMYRWHRYSYNHKIFQIQESQFRRAGGIVPITKKNQSLQYFWEVKKKGSLNSGLLKYPVPKAKICTCILIFKYILI